MLSAAVWLMLSSMLTSLRISGGGSFPKPLTAEEERIYLKRSAEGDLEARNILIERNLRLVAHIMKKYYSQSADQEDLISIGTIGLIKGISTFDASKGARLATYAARCVENAILTQRNNWQLRWRNGCLLRQNGACWREWESAAIF
jgi:RNA polymerase sporulation-specific sigma factor